MSAKQANNRLPPASNVATGENKASGALRTGHHRYQIRKKLSVFSTPESVCYISKAVARSTLVKPLICRAALQASKMLYIWAHLYIVEVSLVHSRRYPCAAAIPAYLHFRICLMHIAGKHIYILRLRVAAHKADARYVVAILPYKAIEHQGVSGSPTSPQR